MNNLDLSHVKLWRNEFPILNEKIYLANCSQSPQSIRVRSAINEYLESWRYSGMDWEGWLKKTQEAKQQFASLINAEVDEISLTLSVSDATAAVLSALPVSPRRKIITTMIDFPTIGQVLLAHPQFQAVFVPQEDYIIPADRYDDYLDQQTLLLCTPHVCYQNGYKQNIELLAKKAHAQGAWIYVDAYQSLGTEPLDVKAMDIDMLSSGALKYLLGIPGIAFLYIKKELARQLKPQRTGWFGQQNPFSFAVNKLDYASGTRRFDTGTPPIIAAYAAAEGLKIINSIGVKAIKDHISVIKKTILKKCREYDLPVFSPTDPDLSGAAVAIMADNAHDLEHKLAVNNIITSARGPVIRIAPHFFTLPEDIELTIPLIKKYI